MVTGRAGQGPANRQTQNRPAQIRPDPADLASLKLKLGSFRSGGYFRCLWFVAASYPLTLLTHKPVVVPASAGVFHPSLASVQSQADRLSLSLAFAALLMVAMALLAGED